MAKFVCTGQTYHFPNLFRVGDIYNGSAENLPRDKKGEPLNFRLIEGNSPTKSETLVNVIVNEKAAGASEVTEEPASIEVPEIMESKTDRSEPQKKALIPRSHRKLKTRRGWTSPKAVTPVP